MEEQAFEQSRFVFMQHNIMSTPTYEAKVYVQKVTGSLIAHSHVNSVFT